MSHKRNMNIPPLASFVNIAASFMVSVLIGIGYFAALADLPVTI
ncbi:MAG: hypothetical protein V3V30_07585 [Parvularculaceae bacterium]